MKKKRPSITISDQSPICDSRNGSSAQWKTLYDQEHQLRIKLQKQNEILKIKCDRARDKKLQRKIICEKCELEQPKKTLKNLKLEYQTFSKSIQKKIKTILPDSVEHIIGSDAQEHVSEQINNKQIPFIQNFAVLGIPDEVISNSRNTDRDELQGGVVLSIRKPTDIQEHAVNFAVPSGMTLKTVSGQKIFAKATKLMSSSYSKQHTFLLTFQPKQGRFDSLCPQNLKILDLLNPSRKLFCLCVGTYDFTYIKNSSNDLDSYSDRSFQQNKRLSDTSSVNTSGLLPNYSDVQEITGGHEIGISQRVYCIISYFPFFSFYADILLAILNIIKVQRLGIYRHRIQDIKKIDSKFQISRLKKIYSKFLKKFNQSSVRLNMTYHLNLINENPIISTQENNILYSQTEEWDFQVLSIFNLDNFIDILTLFLLEDKLFFVCDQSRILTYTVFLVSNYLCRPFKSAFPSVCILPKEQQFLNAPFPGVYGILKKKEWINQKQILQRFKNTYIFVDPSEVKIKYTQNKDDLLDKRPKKLKKQLAPLFQEIKKRKDQKRKLLKYQNQQTQYSWHSDREDRDSIIKILETVKRYLLSQVWSFIPESEVLRKIKCRVEKQSIPEKKDEHTFLMDQIIAHILQERNNKDPFIEHLLKTQMLSVHISERLDKLMEEQNQNR